jgi:hypothetical protein
MNKRATFVTAVAAVILAAGTAIAAAATGSHASTRKPPAAAVLSPESMATVETVDGNVLPVREYELFLARDRAETFAYFQQHYGVADSAKFWTTAYGGETPSDHLKHAALADATSALVQQALAVKYGVVAWFNYAGFLTEWQNQNASRAAAVAAHQVIYGPTSYSESDYFTYVSEQMSEQLRAVLPAKGVIKVTDAELEDYYNAHKSQFQPGASAEQSVGSPRVAGPPGPSTVAGFAQLKPVVEQYYVRDAYTALVAQQTQRAAIHGDQSVLAAIAIT